jgi:voltage-gated potassium channel
VPKPKKPSRHLALLISILFLFLAAPLIVPLQRGALFLSMVSVAVLLAGSYALIDRKRLFVIAIALSFLAIVTTGLLQAYNQRATAIISHSCIVILVGFFCVTILGYVLRTGQITTDKILAAICVYFLIGYAWTFLYALLNETATGAFSGLTEGPETSYVSQIMQLRYFSFITLTTVGYGDILPRSPMARTLATLEVITGQLYLAVLLARLVGLHIVHGSSNE